MTEYNLQLKVKKYKDRGDIAWEYNPLRNLKDIDDKIVDFRVSNKALGLNLDNPVDIECQTSYDGSTNLIWNDDKNPPRIINTRMALLENNQYKVINRNQIQQTNLYKEKYIDQQTRLFRNITRIPKIQFKSVNYFGQMKAGNYTFYIKYADADYNETDVVCESGVVSIFKGEVANPRTCSGAYMDELTDKSVSMYLKNVDTSFTYVNVYYSRTSCDQNGIVKREFYKIKKRYDIENINQTLTFNGFEEVEPVSVEEINKQYNYVESVKTQAQVQNMLFFANVNKLKEDSVTLKRLALNIIVAEAKSEESIGYVSNSYTIQKTSDVTQSEYYSPYNIYYRLGYFPGELYRLGIVFIYNDDHLSPVYNLRGIDFNNASSVSERIAEGCYTVRGLDNNAKVNFLPKKPSEDSKDKDDIFAPEEVENEDILDNASLENTRGVFRFTKNQLIIDHTKREVRPVCLRFIITHRIMNILREMNIKGFYFVRQQRIPTFLFSGLSVSIDSVSGVPCLVKENKDKKTILFTESFINPSGTLTHDFNTRLIESEGSSCSGLLSVDVKCDKQMQSLLASDKYKMVLDTTFTKGLTNDGRKYYFYIDQNEGGDTQNTDNISRPFNQREEKLMYVPSESPQIIIDDMSFSTKAALQEEVKQQQCFGKEDNETKDAKLVRGIFTDFVGCSGNLQNFSIYNVYIKNFSEVFNREYFNIRINDNSPYFAITDRYSTHVDGDLDYDLTEFTVDGGGKTEKAVGLYAFRGDCFTYTTTVRMQRNFISNSVPTNDTIVDFSTFKDNFKGIRNTENWEDINLGDINAVNIGHWVTFKGLSNNNISLRSVDTFNTDEMAVMGNPRVFYPFYEVSVRGSMKIPESDLYNRGYSTTLGYKRNYLWAEVPFETDEFDTRVMFSNVQVDKEFKNAYKIFQGLSYQDYDRQFGGIVKILPWEGNLLAVFEHAVTLIPVNQKALLNTTTGQSIHMYGAEVLQKQMTIVTDMYGSIWKDSIIRTPLYVYGVDTYAKKIWRLGSNGLETISDFTIQRFLNDEINLKELDKNVILGERNVKTHFNAYKNDVMFTFYNRGKQWNLCFNEVRNMWVTRYSWIPLMSANINNTFLSFDLSKCKVYGIINDNLRRDGEVLLEKDWTGMIDGKSSKVLKFSVKDYENYNVDAVTVRGYSWEDEFWYIDSNTSEEVNKKVLKETTLSDVEFDYTTGQATDKSGNGTTGWYIFKNVYLLSNEEAGKEEHEIQQALYNKYVTLGGAKFSLDLTSCIAAHPECLYYTIEVKYTPYLIASLEVDPDKPNSELLQDDENDRLVFGLQRDYTFGLMYTYKALKDTNHIEYQDDWNKLLLHNVYMHGRSNIADEINYFDEERRNQCRPTLWYDKQEPFEFEFIVSAPIGLHKIFDNLRILANNVEPDAIEIEITGDVYHFDKEGAYWNNYNNPDEKEFSGNNVLFKDVNILKGLQHPEKYSRGYKTTITWDPIRDEYFVNNHIDCLNMNIVGRRLGNILYNEDSWYFQVPPIYYCDKKEGNVNNTLRTTRVRDKYARIRIKYRGDKLTVITAIQTLMTQSYV